ELDGDTVDVQALTVGNDGRGRRGRPSGNGIGNDEHVRHRDLLGPAPSCRPSRRRPAARRREEVRASVPGPCTCRDGSTVRAPEPARHVHNGSVPHAYIAPLPQSAYASAAASELAMKIRPNGRRARTQGGSVPSSQKRSNSALYWYA